MTINHSISIMYYFMYNFFLLCVLTCVSGMHHTLHTKQDIRNPFRFQSMSRRSNSPDSPLKEVSNVTGVDLKYVSKIQQQMEKRAETLDDALGKINEGLSDMDKTSTMNSLRGVTLESEIIDPRDISNDILALEKKKKESEESISKHLTHTLLGTLNPPIIIIESSELDPLEHHILMKLLTCRVPPKRTTIV